MGSKGAAHLLLGPEAGEKAAWVDTLVRTITESEGERPPIERFYLGDGELGVFLDGLRTGDLFARHRVALIQDIQDLSKADGDRLTSYLESPSPAVTLILLSTATRLPAREPAGRATKSLPESSRKIFWELFAGQKTAFVRKFFATRKMTIDDDATEYLLDIVESNTREIGDVCEKLALLHTPGETIGIETVEQYVYHSKDESAFTLFDRLAPRELVGSLEILQKLLLSPASETGGILPALVSQFRKLLDLKLRMAEGKTADQAMESAYIRGKRNQQSFRQACRAYTLEEVRAVISLTARTEAQLRSTRSDLQGLILSLYLYHVVVRGGLPHTRARPRPHPSQAP